MSRMKHNNIKIFNSGLRKIQILPWQQDIPQCRRNTGPANNRFCAFPALDGRTVLVRLEESAGRAYNKKTRNRNGTGSRKERERSNQLCHL